MITKKNLEEARLAEAKAKDAYETARVNLDAYKKFINEVNQGIWDPANDQVPTSGPFTVDQAKLMSVNLEEDYAYPQVFTNQEIWYKAAKVFEELNEKVKTLNEEYEATKKTATDIENEYIEEQERAAEVAANDPSVIAAQENIEAERLKSELEQKKMEERKENRRMIITGLIGLAVVSVFVIIMAKVLK